MRFSRESTKLNARYLAGFGSDFAGSSVSVGKEQVRLLCASESPSRGRLRTSGAGAGRRYSSGTALRSEIQPQSRESTSEDDEAKSRAETATPKPAQTPPHTANTPAPAATRTRREKPCRASCPGNERFPAPADCPDSDTSIQQRAA